MSPDDLSEGAGGELLYASEHTRVVRHGPPGAAGSFICKESIGPDAARRQRHERALIARLAGIEGAPQLAPGQHADHVLPLVDVGGVTLEHVLASERLDPAALLALALRLARLIGEVHRAGVLHLDINPSNILLTGPQRRPVLIDFHLGATFGDERADLDPRDIVAGTLAYLAPERTGRTGRRIDARTDLYALGATLYEAAVGHPPFRRGDPLDLIRDHLVLVPAPPVELNPQLPRTLSDILLRLLEKEPERRYQSADGLAHDLQRLAEGGGAPFVLGERDFPARLGPSSSLIGREAEVAELHAAFEASLRGEVRCVLVAGRPGVGKSSLMQELQSLARARGGCYVSGKFDPYRHDAPPATAQALRSLARLLLAEPDAALLETRACLLGALGSNAGLITAMVPEFALLLGPQPEPAAIDPVEADTRLCLTVLRLLQAVASPARPLVVALHDLQWAGPGSFRLIESLLNAEDNRGLLLLGSYRDDEIGPDHLLSAMLPRWQRLDHAPLHLHLENLPPHALARLLADMLRLGGEPAARLAQAIAEHTAGNPFDTLELVNALRRDGVLRPAAGDDTWRWDDGALRRHLDQGTVIDRLAARVARLPPPTRALLDTLACLGGEVSPELLQAATGEAADSLRAQLAPALDDALLVIDHQQEGQLRFPHDRVHQAVYGMLDAGTRQDLHLRMARRLAAVPALHAQAAEQYRPAAGAVTDAAEARLAAGLLQRAAAQSRLGASHLTAESFLRAAREMLLRLADPADTGALMQIEIDWHAALYSLGRTDEADQVYLALDAQGHDPLRLSEAVSVQVSSLTTRRQPRAAVSLGMQHLRRLGLEVPGADRLEAEVDRRYEAFCLWVEQDLREAGPQRPVSTEPRVLAAARLINRMMSPSFFVDPTTRAWLILESQRLWVEHGPCAALMANLSRAPLLTIGLRGDYRTGYTAARHVLAVGEHLRFEPETSQARHLFALTGAHWFESLEDTAQQVQRAREGLLQGGDLQNASSAYFPYILSRQDNAPHLDAYADEIDAALAFATRTGNDRAPDGLLPQRQLVLALRGQTASPGSFSDSRFDEDAHIARMGQTSMAAVFHIHRALGAALFDDMPRLLEHAAAAMPLLPRIPGFYATAIAHLLQVLALAERLRKRVPGERARLLGALDASRTWLARRALDAPMNFRHLSLLADAERAWATEDFHRAVGAYDAALREVEPLVRPWHKALIAERAAHFHLAHGLQRAGRQLLREAAQTYADWGASAKVAQLQAGHAFLRTARDATGGAPRAPGSSGVSAESIDMLAVLRASQALSSETSLDRLIRRVIELLGTMTGAERVQVVLRSEGPPGWSLAAATPVEGGDAALPLPVDTAGDRGLLPLSAFRYVARTGTPLLLADAVHDDRFASDPYLAGLLCCSLLLVPILGQGQQRAVLLLENRLSRGAFSADRLDAVMLVAGQLAVSLENARLYASLEQRVAERTAALEQANLQLLRLSVTDPLTGLSNRRRFDEVLANEWQRALRTGQWISALMIDVDQFKLYNDHYGHLAGDSCLQQVGAALQQGLRQGTDLAARYGGEEFALILSGTGPDGAREVGERIRGAIEALQSPHATSRHGVVTVSIGVASVIPAAGLEAARLFDLADAALYEAKRAGRNRVEIHRSISSSADPSSH